MSATKKILLVDDNDFILCMMEKFISEWPEYETSTASNGQEAIDMINQEEFDLVITDILMPKKNGIELVTEIQKRDQKIPVIVISAGDGSPHQDSYLNYAGYFVNDTLSKPFAKNDLRSTISMALSAENSDFLQYL